MDPYVSTFFFSIYFVHLISKAYSSYNLNYSLKTYRNIIMEFFYKLQQQNNIKLKT